MFFIFFYFLEDIVFEAADGTTDFDALDLGSEKFPPDFFGVWDAPPSLVFTVDATFVLTFCDAERTALAMDGPAAAVTAMAKGVNISCSDRGMLPPVCFEPFCCLGGMVYCIVIKKYGREYVPMRKVTGNRKKWVYTCLWPHL